MISNYLLIAVKIFLFATILTPLIITNQTVAPFIWGKTVFFRVLVEIALILFLVLVLLKKESSVISHRPSVVKLFKNPLFLSLIAFLLSLIVSSIFTATPYRAFWGNVDRGEGLWGMLHFFVFLGIALAVFNKKEWRAYFKLSLIVGIIVVSVGILQFKNFVSFSFLTDPSDGSRPGSLIGNAALFAGYISALLILAVFVIAREYADSPSQILQKQNLGGRAQNNAEKIGSPILNNGERFWRVISMVFLLLAVVGIFVSGTRGAMLGIVGGIITVGILAVIFSRDKMVKKIVVGVFVLLAIFGSLFLVTKNNNFWQNIPGFERLAETNLGGSARTRVFAWQISFEAFKEKPFFGWGLEHFITAYAAHYNPLEPIKGNIAWLDRAHNRFVDILVMQGIFGFLSYIAVLVSVFYLLFKQHSKKIAIFASGAFIAYIIQNFFVFDDLNTYIPFFALLGFLISEQSQIAKRQSPIANDPSLITNYWLLVTKIVIVMLIVIVGYSIYAYNYIPYTQSKYARIAIGAVRDDEKEVPILERVLFPYNFTQNFLRSYIIDARYMNNEFIFEDSRFSKQATLLEKALDEIIIREPQNDIRWYIRKNQISVVMARRDERYYKIAEAAARDGLKFAPKRQEAYYALIFALIGQNRFAEAIETATFALKLNPEMARSHYYLAFASALAGNQNNLAEEISWFEINDPYLEQLTWNDKAGMMINYSIAKRDDKIAELILGLIEGRWYLRVDSNEPYVTAFRYFVTVHDIQGAATVAKFLIDSNIIVVENPDGFIDAIREGRWELIGEDVDEQKSQPAIKVKESGAPPSSKESLLQSLKDFITARNKENVLKTARDLMQQFPETADDMEVIIDLANKGEWGILEKL